MISYLGPLNLFLPEIGLILLILVHLSADLIAKAHPLKLVQNSILGGFLILGLLCFLWPVSGQMFRGAFQLDAFAILFKGVFLLSGILVLFMVLEYFETLGERAGDFSLLILVAVLGAFFLASSNDLITLFITIEWITISLYVLTSYLKKDSYALEAGTKYLIMGAFSGALFLYGMSFVYGVVGGLGFDHIRHVLAARPDPPLLAFGFLLILSGIGFKVAAFPFQLWVPDVYQGAPTPVTAFLSVASKAAGFAALFKILFLVIGPDHFHWQTLLSLLSALSLLYGNLGALGQTNMKRLFGYSSIGHAGYLLMGLSTGTEFGCEAALFYLVAYAVSNLAAFLVIVIANRELGGGEIADYRGLAKKAPLLSGVFFIALLSLGGIPPLAGFFGKFLVLQAAIMKGYLWLAILGAVNVIISLYYYLSVIKEMYFKSPGRQIGKIRIRMRPQVLLILLAASIIGIGVFQAPIVDWTQAAAKTLF